ncbi:CdiA C-terminal domain-containing protein [Kitasatospora cineracea]
MDDVDQVAAAEQPGPTGAGGGLVLLEPRERVDVGGGLAIGDGLNRFDDGLRVALRQAEESNISGSGGAAARTAAPLKPSSTPNPDAAPTGRRTSISSSDDPGTVRSKTRENETADYWAQKGYRVEQNPDSETFTAEDAIGPTRKPDYRIEGEIVDCYSPDTDNVRSIWTEVKKKVDKKQAYRVIVNTSDSTVNLPKLIDQFKTWKITDLKQVFVQDAQGKLIPIYP